MEKIRRAIRCKIFGFGFFCNKNVFAPKKIIITKIVESHEFSVFMPEKHLRAKNLWENKIVKTHEFFNFHAPKKLRRRKSWKRRHGLYFISSFGSRFITWWQWRTSRRSSCIPGIQWVCFRADQKTQDLLLPTAWSFLTTRLKKTMTECLASASRCMTFPTFFLIHFHIYFI